MVEPNGCGEGKGKNWEKGGCRENKEVMGGTLRENKRERMMGEVEKEMVHLN